MEKCPDTLNSFGPRPDLFTKNVVYLLFFSRSLTGALERNTLDSWRSRSLGIEYHYSGWVPNRNIEGLIMRTKHLIIQIGGSEKSLPDGRE